MAEKFPYDRSSKWLIQHHGDSILRLAGLTGLVSWKPLQALGYGGADRLAATPPFGPRWPGVSFPHTLRAMPIHLARWPLFPARNRHRAKCLAW
jgi:hypothetical protein